MRARFPIAACAVSLPALLASFALPLHAQPRADLQAAPRFTLDAGANAVSWTAFPGVATSSPRQSGVTIAPGVHIDGARHTLDLTGSWTNDPAGGGIVQGSGMLSVYTPSRGALRGEFTGNASGSRLADGFSSARAMGGARLHASGTRAGAWLGAQAGIAGYDSAWRSVQQPEAGVWYAFPSSDGSAASPGAVVLTATPTAVAYDGDTEHYTDVEAGVRIVRGRAEMGVSLGTRTARTAGVVVLGGATAWGTLAATVWMTPQVAFTGSAGTYPVDAIMRFPGGRFLSAGVRMAWGRAPSATTTSSSVGAPSSRTATEAAPMREAGEKTAPVIARPALLVADGTGDQRALRLLVPASAQRVEIAGTFSNWSPIMLTRTSAGTFAGAVRIARGQHQVAVRIDGGAWMAPRDLVVVRDEFGGEAGVLVMDR